MEKVIKFLFVLMMSSLSASSQKSMYQHFESKADIIAWLHKDFASRVEDSCEFKTDHGALFVVTKDYGFGMARMGVSLFLKEERGWKLICFHNTNSTTSSVRVDYEKRLLLIKSESSVLLSLSLEAIGL
jgi:hypothetical protein